MQACPLLQAHLPAIIRLVATLKVTDSNVRYSDRKQRVSSSKKKKSHLGYASIEEFNTFKLMLESTTTGDFPPSSKRTGVRCFAAACITIRPTLELPTKWKTFKSLFHFGCEKSSSSEQLKNQLYMPSKYPSNDSNTG